MHVKNAFILLTQSSPDETVKGFMPVVDYWAKYYAGRGQIHKSELRAVGMEAVWEARNSYDPKYRHNAFNWVKQKVRSKLSQFVQTYHKPYVSLNNTNEAGYEYQDLIETPDPDPEGQLMIEEHDIQCRQRLGKAIKKMTDRQKRIMKWKYLMPKPWTAKQIAEELNMGVRMVNKEIQLVRRLIRTHCS